jgi:hypothetical protein
VTSTGLESVSSQSGGADDLSAELRARGRAEEKTEIDDLPDWIVFAAAY